MKTKHDWTRADAMADKPIHAAALADPAAQPLTEERLARMKQAPCETIIRRAMGSTQEEFAARFQCRSEPCGIGSKAPRNPIRLPAPACER